MIRVKNTIIRVNFFIFPVIFAANLQQIFLISQNTPLNTLKILLITAKNSKSTIINYKIHTTKFTNYSNHSKIYIKKFTNYSKKSSVLRNDVYI